MPKQAVELGAVLYILPLEQIAPALEAMLNAECGTNRMRN
jgi:chemotaxis response regulator CheB